MSCKRYDEMLSNLCVLHQYLKKSGFSYENFNGSQKISFNHNLTLMLLRGHEKLSMSEIKELVGTNRQNMTYIIDALVGTGLVKRMPDMNDRRVVNIMITDEGNKYLNEWKKDKIEDMTKIFVSLNDEDLEKMYNSIENIIDILIRNGN